MTLRGIQIIILFLSFACKTHQSQQVNIRSEIDLFYDQYIQYHPLKATWRGDFRFNDSLENSASQEYQSQYQHFLTEYLNKFKGFKNLTLSRSDEISLDVLIWQLNKELQGLKFNRYWGHNDNLRPFNHFECRAVEISHFGRGLGFPFRNKQDYYDFIDRMKDFEIWVDTAFINMKRGILIGDVSPGFTIEKYLPVLKSYTSTDPKENSFYKPLEQLPQHLSEQDKKEIKEFYTKAIADHFIPVFTKIIDFLEKEYLPYCRDTDGMIHLPQGDAEYRYLVSLYTTSGLKPEEIFETGIKEVQRIKKEMIRLKDVLQYPGSLEDFMVQLDHDQNNFPFKNNMEILEAYQKMLAIVTKNLSSQFAEYPKTPFEIKVDNTPGNSERIQYFAGSLKDSIPGIFSFAIPNPHQFRKLDMENIFLHEGIPGHHFQISFARERPDIPKFHRDINFTAFTEGWALYAEGLGEELGLYSDPMQYLGRLIAEMMRAARLVIDVGIHHKGWSRKKALDFYEKECLLGDGTSEVDRITVFPGQALSYKIGELAILKMKHKAQQQLGSKFDVKKFHHVLLKNGALPIEILERQIDDWINQMN